jgi:protocatechuate 3,4-dioxygenase beta subunit
MEHLEEHDDDKPVGRLLTRREIMKILGAGSAAALIAPALPFGSALSLGATSCVAKPEFDEGPYFVDPVLSRSDIRSDSNTGTVTPGVPLALAFNISQLANGGCTALPGASVDIWQCDAVGRYSGFSDGRQEFDTLGQNFLRGVQQTDPAGRAAFTTIYPGWYRGRAVHIHVKIRTKAPGGAYEFTTQLFFDDALSDTVHAQPPYAAHGQRDRTNARDGIFQSGDKTVLNVSPRDGGYAATFDLALDLSDAAAGRPDGGRGGRGRGRGRSGEIENA